MQFEPRFSRVGTPSAYIKGKLDDGTEPLFEIARYGGENADTVFSVRGGLGGNPRAWVESTVARQAFNGWPYQTLSPV